MHLGNRPSVEERGTQPRTPIFIVPPGLRYDSLSDSFQPTGTITPAWIATNLVVWYENDVNPWW